MHRTLFSLLLIAALTSVRAQDSLLDLLGEQETIEYTDASFKTSRVINSHSLENTAHGVLDFKIGHRFGFLNLGPVEAFGLDQATIRLGLDYGLTDRIMVGIGRSSYQKTVDGFVKYKFLRQCKSGCHIPLTAALVAGMTTTTVAKENTWWYDESRTDYYTHRLGYNFQLIMGRKFSDNFSLQLMPGMIHRNLIRSAKEQHDVMNIGAAGRVKLTNRLAINAEYFYVLPGQLYGDNLTEEQLNDPNPGFHNSLSIGFDIETGGHVFQLHFTNSTAMYERGVITETTGDWLNGDIHFGFNISRVFTLHRPKPKEPKPARKRKKDGVG
ncbi:MAG: hypothetical protein H6595_13675 [Flavobacteriales bacterium]|nr:hypothetical protein [Flavobacteriales bacterium]MCB9168515.1 hypothetical protein [Flavobacteriales bacterium]